MVRSRSRLIKKDCPFIRTGGVAVVDEVAAGVFGCEPPSVGVVGGDGDPCRFAGESDRFGELLPSSIVGVIECGMDVLLAHNASGSVVAAGYAWGGGIVPRGGQFAVAQIKN